jgi:hypothetical protein
VHVRGQGWLRQVVYGVQVQVKKLEPGDLVSWQLTRSFAPIIGIVIASNPAEKGLPRARWTWDIITPAGKLHKSVPEDCLTVVSSTKRSRASDDTRACPSLDGGGTTFPRGQTRSSITPASRARRPRRDGG